MKRVLPNKSANGSVTSLSLQDEEGRISVDDEEELETADEDSIDEEEQIASEGIIAIILFQKFSFLIL